MMSMPKVGYEYVQLEGGLDVVTSPLKIPGGKMTGCRNFEIDQYGGYRRIDGYERFDGQPAPSSATYQYLPATISGALVSGNILTGLISGATGTVIATEASAIILTKTTGVFEQGELVQVAAVTRATTTDISSTGGALSIYNDALYLSLAAEQYRPDILAVPGEGQIRGVQAMGDTVYAFRDNVGSTACKVYESSAAGWVLVDLGYQVAFSNANTSVGEGDTLTQGGVTATVTRVALQTGTLASGVNTGRLILSTPSGGAFSAGAATTSGSGALTLSGASSAIALLPGGRYEFVNTDFGPGERIYGCDGVNPGFEFDGTVFVPILTGMAADKPKFVAAHKNHLFFAFGRSLQHSAIGTPYSWSVVLGAAETNAGDTITGLVQEPGSASGAAMTVYTRSKTQILYGSSSADWTFVMFQADSGALPYTVQKVGTSFSLDDRGVNRIGSSQAYGNFNHSVLSRLVSPLLDGKRFSATCSSVHRLKNQYRVFFDDDTSLVMSIDKDTVLGFTECDFLRPVRVICSIEDTRGEPQTYFGSDDGYIYHLDKGTSFDGENIISFFSTPYYAFKTPRTRKRFRTAVLQTRAASWVQATTTFYLGYGAGDIAQEPTRGVEFSAAGSSVWDVSNWDELSWDGVSDFPRNTDLSGTAENLSMIVSCDSNLIKPFTINGVVIHFTTRRDSR